METDKNITFYLAQEVNRWRINFTNEAFSGDFKFIPETYKERLIALFMAIPSNAFTDPWQEWNKCISTLLQHLENEE